MGTWEQRLEAACATSAFHSPEPRDAPTLHAARTAPATCRTTRSSPVGTRGPGRRRRRTPLPAARSARAAACPTHPTRVG
eukprot:428377-Prymnesium_polylepis.1